MNKELIEEFAERELLRGLSPGTVNRKKREVERLLEFHSGMNRRKKSITKEGILAFLEFRGKRLNANSLRDRLSCINEFFEFLVWKDEIFSNPAASIEKGKRGPGGTRGVFTEEEVKRVLKSIDDTPRGVRDRAVLELFYSTGLRRNELLSLDIDDVDFRTGEITVRKGKGGKERIVPAGHEALNMLKRYLKERLKVMTKEREALFLGIRGKRLNAETVKRRIKYWKNKANVGSKGGPHAFRHSFASHMLKNGAPLPVIQRVLGHGNLCTTQIYTHVLPDDLRKVHTNCHPKAGKEE